MEPSFPTFFLPLPSPSSLPSFPTPSSPTPLSSGTHTVILRAYLHHTPVALKFLRASLPEEHVESLHKSLMHEAAITSALRHPNIPLVLGLVQSPPANLASPRRSGLAFELADGSLKCEKYRGRVHDGLKVMEEVGRALTYAHAGGIVHRDVKPSQVLMFSGVAKLGDWGLGRVIEDEMTGETGTWEYMAPEVIRSEKYTDKADVYSFGLLLYAVVCGSDYPYESLYLTAAQAAMGVARKGLRPPVDGLAKDVRGLIEGCWKQESDERLSMSQVMERLIKLREERMKKKESGGLLGWMW